MNITEIKPGMPMTTELPKPTEKEIKNEYSYILAENLTKKLLEKGLISLDEFNKITEKNKQTFSPLFSQI